MLDPEPLQSKDCVLSLDNVCPQVYHTVSFTYVFVFPYFDIFRPHASQQSRISHSEVWEESHCVMLQSLCDFQTI